MKNKNKTKISFIWYLVKHPNERLWQALRNWSKRETIYAESFDEDVDDDILLDTFYWE